MTTSSQALYLPSRDIPSVKQLTPIRVTERPQGIAVLASGEKRVIKMNEILRCEADSNYCFIHDTEGRKVIVAKTLKSVGQALTPGFFRVHQSHIVRLDAIQEVHPVHVTLANGDLIPISRRNKKGLIRTLAGMAS